MNGKVECHDSVLLVNVFKFSYQKVKKKTALHTCKRPGNASFKKLLIHSLACKPEVCPERPELKDQGCLGKGGIRAEDNKV